MEWLTSGAWTTLAVSAFGSGDDARSNRDQHAVGVVVVAISFTTETSGTGDSRDADRAAANRSRFLSACLARAERRDRRLVGRVKR